jgi:hypothetical protein
MASSYSQDEVRQCVRSLVGIIRSASQQSSPVDDAQLAHIRKVVKLLSLSDEQIAAMEPSERQTVTSIRESAVSKWRMANAVRESAHSSPSAGGVPRMQTDPGGHGVGAPMFGGQFGGQFGGHSPLDAAASLSMTHHAHSGPAGFGGPGPGSSAVPIGGGSRSNSLTDDMPPPSFYVRKTL